MAKGAMDYFRELERGMKERGIEYVANMWDYALPEDAAAEVAYRPDGARVIRLTGIRGRTMRLVEDAPSSVRAVVITIKKRGPDDYSGVEPLLDVDFGKRTVWLDASDLYSVGGYLADPLRNAVEEVVFGIGFSMER